MLYYIVFYCSILHSITLNNIIVFFFFFSYRILLYYVKLYSVKSYCILLYFIELYIISYCFILDYIVLHHIIAFHHIVLHHIMIYHVICLSYLADLILYQHSSYSIRFDKIVYVWTYHVKDILYYSIMVYGYYYVHMCDATIYCSITLW